MKEKEAMEQKLNDAIFDKVEKPKGFLFVKSHNVYNDRYRVNIYSDHVENSELNIMGKRISHSYFCKYDGENLTILSA